MRAGSALASIVVAALLAGCTGGTKTASHALAATVDVGQGQGHIVGLVLDTEQRPLADATVRILSKSDAGAPVVTLRTNATGGFEAQGLAEGAYVIYATMAGYKDLLPLSVQVVSGAATNVVLLLQEQKVLTPYHVSVSHTVKFDAHACVVASGAPPCYTVWDPGNVTTIFKNSEEDTGLLEDLIVEAVWTPNVAVCANGIRTDVFSPDQKGLDLTEADLNAKYWNSSNPYWWSNVPAQTRSPTRVDAAREAGAHAMLAPERTKLDHGRPINVTGEWKIQTWPYSGKGGLGTPVDVDCMAEQEATVWTTAFFVRPAPADWSVFTEK